MIEATVKLTSLSEYGQSKVIDPELFPKKPKETSADYEERTWRERMHVTPDGNVKIPAMAIKNCLAEAAKYLSMQVPGKGKATYTKHFEAGVMVTESPILPINAKDVEGVRYFVPASGKRGDGKRVWKTFPIIPTWEATVTFIVLDHAITKEVFVQHLSQAGNFIGIGWFRPRNNGTFGRFKAELLDWDEISDVG